VVQRGNYNFVFSQYIGQCAAGGAPDLVPGPWADPDLQDVLHDDPASPDS
jgi:hypothetical protein